MRQSGGLAAWRPLVVLLDVNSVRRADLARALVADGFDVRVTPADVEENEPPRLAIVQFDAPKDPRVAELLRMLTAAHPGLPLVVGSADPDEATAEMTALGAVVATTFAPNTSSREVVARARTLVAALAGTASPAPNVEEAPSRERIAPEVLLRVPALLVSREDLGWFEADEQEAAVLAVLDGAVSLATIASQCQFPAEQALRIVGALVARGLVTWGAG